MSGHRIEGASRLVVVDGILDQALSDTAVLPAEVYCGGLQGAPAEVVDRYLVSTGLIGGHIPALVATEGGPWMHAAAVPAWGALAGFLSTWCQVLHLGHLQIMAQDHSCTTA